MERKGGSSPPLLVAPAVVGKGPLRVVYWVMLSYLPHLFRVPPPRLDADSPQPMLCWHEVCSTSLPQAPPTAWLRVGLQSLGDLGRAWGNTPKSGPPTNHVVGVVALSC